MKRLFYTNKNSNYSVKMFEAPVSWSIYPKATTVVTSNMVKGSAFHDKARLFSALIRVARRQMTFNEASASHHLTINIIKEVYQKIFTTMSTVMMDLMDARKRDMDLTGTEMDESNFPFDPVSEQDLTIAVNEKGEQYAYSSAAPNKRGRFDSSLDHGQSHYIVPKEETRYVSYNQLVIPKDEEIDPFPTQCVMPKEEEFGGYDDDFIMPKEEDEAGCSYKFDDDLFLGDKEIKSEPVEDFYSSQDNYQSQPTRILGDVGHYAEERDAFAVKLEEDEDPEEEDRNLDEDDNEEINQSIEMAIASSKIAEPHATVMRAALKDSMIHDVSVPDIVTVYSFPDHTAIVNLINKARVFLAGICRKSEKSLPANFASSSAHKTEFTPGEPLDPLDEERIGKIREVLAALSRRCAYSKTGKAALRAALFSVSIGELTVNAASNKFNLPSSTISPYVMKARQRLGSLLPPPANAPILWHNQAKEYRPAEYSEDVIDTTPDASGKRTYTMEQLDKTVADLVSCSRYDQQGKQTIFEAVVSVIANGVSAPEASKRTGIPVSTIQTYVGRTKSILKFPATKGLIDFVPRRKEPPTVALMTKQETSASREDVVKYTHSFIKALPDANRRGRVFRAIVAAVMGETTIRDAAEKEGLPASTIHPYVTKVRHILGQRCPPPKLVVNTIKPTLARTGQRIDDDRMLTITEDEAVTINGISVPRSLRLLTRLLTIGQVDYSKAQPFMGSKDQLKQKIIQILEAFRHKGDCDNLARGIIHVYVEDKAISEACSFFKLSHTTLTGYGRAIKIFINFSTSPCSNEYKYEQFKSQSLSTMKSIQGGVEEEEHGIRKFPHSHPRSEPVFMSEAAAHFAEENACAGFLSEDERQKDLFWQGEGLDLITRRMKLCFQHSDWKFDENGDKNVEILPIILRPQVPEMKRMDRLKSVVQYVINERDNTRTRLYLRPLLIHHLCNGLPLDYLMSIYEDRVPITEEKLNEYRDIIVTIYAKTGPIMQQFAANLTKCAKILDIGEDYEENGRNAIEKDRLRNEIVERFPFFCEETKWFPQTTEKLTQQQVQRRMYECDFFTYYALKAVIELQKIGFLITNPLINEIVRMAIINIPDAVCSRENSSFWATQYIKHPLIKHRSSLSRGDF